MTNKDRSYFLLRSLGVSIENADEVSCFMEKFTFQEQNILYYWLRGYYIREIMVMLRVSKNKVNSVIAKTKGIGGCVRSVA